MLCRCSVDSNPTAAVTWSVNGTVPPHNYNTSVSSEPHVLTATLQGRMDEPLSVTCFVVNALGNDSLALLQPGEGLDLLQCFSPGIYLMVLEGNNLQVHGGKNVCVVSHWRGIVTSRPKCSVCRKLLSGNDRTLCRPTSVLVCANRHSCSVVDGDTCRGHLPACIPSVPPILLLLPLPAKD